MKKLILTFPIIKISLILSAFVFLFITFFTSPLYKSQSVIDVSLNESESISSSLVDSILPSSGANDAFQVKLFLESYEASSIFRDKLNIEELFVNDAISAFSRFRVNSRKNFHDYFQDKINILVDGDSNTLIIETYAFNPKDAKNINLNLINMTADFFNRKSKLASLNAKSNKICELYSANIGILDLEGLKTDADFYVDGSQSANDLLVAKAEKYKDECLEQLEEASFENDKINFLNIPSFELKNINAEASKRIITDLYQKSMDAVSESDYMEIIVEPMVPDKPEDRRAWLFGILTFILVLICLISLRIIVKLSDEFNP
tara:strand:+ start:377 stop:1333 length:957 start_codon:yes stop_codon:yes gene_type:complete